MASNANAQKDRRDRGGNSKSPKSPRQDRRLRMAQRVGLFTDDTKGTRIVRGCTAADIKGAFAVVHRTFVEKGYIFPSPGGLRIRKYEAVQEMSHFVAKAGSGQVVGSLSVIPDSPDLGVPCDVAFKEQVDRLRASGLRLCEMTNQAVDKPYRRSAILSELLRACFAQCFVEGFEEVVGTVSPGHAGFFELVGFRRIGDVKSYTDKVEDPVVLLACNIADLKASLSDADSGPGTGRLGEQAFIKHYLFGGNPYLPYIRSWHLLARRIFNRSEVLRELFVETGFLDECGDEVRRLILERWGERRFAEALGVATQG